MLKKNNQIPKKNKLGENVIQETSLEAYEILLPNLGKMQSRIYNILKIYPNSSNLDISRFINKPINGVTPRVKELRDKGLVVQSGHKVDQETKRRVMTWRPVMC